MTEVNATTYDGGDLGVRQYNCGGTVLRDRCRYEKALLYGGLQDNGARVVQVKRVVSKPASQMLIGYRVGGATILRSDRSNRRKHRLFGVTEWCDESSRSTDWTQR